MVTEGKIDFDKLKTILGEDVESSSEKYEFTWNGKVNALKQAYAPSTSTLRPCKEKSKNWDTTENLYIEGDNLEVLKQLQKTYYGRVKMIYIDPPYNTGNDFVYKDDFKNSIENYIRQSNQICQSNPETSGRYHSDWCSMIYPRLLVARNLLSDDGVIFLSIDSHEQSTLKQICDEVFGSQNFINQFVWINKPEGRQLSSPGAAGTHEFIMLYAKDSLYLDEIKLKNEWLKSIMPSVYKSIKPKIYTDEKGQYIITHELYNGNSKFNEETRPTLIFDIYYRESDGDILTEDISNENLHPGYCKIKPHKNSDGIHKYHAFRWSREKIQNDKEDLVFEKSGDSYKIYTKRRDFEYSSVRDVITDITTNSGSKDVSNLKLSCFKYPKPVSLISLFVKMMTDSASRSDEPLIVMDFFSGSATTAHAVMQLNAEDGGSRKFIMVQLPEICPIKSEAYKSGYKNICEIGEERIRRAGDKIRQDFLAKQDQGTLFEDQHTTFNVDVGFKVFRLDSTNIVPWDNANQYNEKSLISQLDIFKDGRTKNDVLYEIMLKYGIFDKSVNEIMINDKIMYGIGNSFMIMCLESSKKINDEDISEILKFKPNVVVFNELCFPDDNAKINAEYNLKRNRVEVKCI